MERAEQAWRSNESWMQSFTGKQVFIFQPERNVLDIEDIAHGLSMICRYGGHCREFYSVAQHSLLVCDVVKGWLQPFATPVFLAALLHDAAESVLGDVLRPFKHSELMQGYRDLEAAWDDHVFSSFGVLNAYRAHYGMIKKADWILLATERRDLMAPPPKPWTEREPPMEATIAPWSPSFARDQFMMRFEELISAL